MVSCKSHRCYGNNSREGREWVWGETHTVINRVVVTVTRYYRDDILILCVGANAHPHIIITVQCLMQGTTVTVCAWSKTQAQSTGAQHLSEDCSSILPKTAVCARKKKKNTICVITLSRHLTSLLHTST